MLHIVLVEPEIPWNTGNAGRTTLAGGASLHLVEPLGFSLDDAQVRRSGLDYWDEVKPRCHADFECFERVLPSLGMPFLFTREAEQSLFDVELPERAVFLFGRESDGFSRGIRERYAAHAVSLPVLNPRVRSLNVSTCVGIAVYEYRRRFPRYPSGREGL